MIIERGLTANPGPKGYADPAMIARQIGTDLTYYLNGLNERIYMLEEQVRIQQGLLKSLNDRIKQLSRGESSSNCKLGQSVRCDEACRKCRNKYNQ